MYISLYIFMYILCACICMYVVDVIVEEDDVAVDDVIVTVVADDVVVDDVIVNVVEDDVVVADVIVTVVEDDVVVASPTLCPTPPGTSSCSSCRGSALRDPPGVDSTKQSQPLRPLSR